MTTATPMTERHRAWATIDLNALRKNLAMVRSHCPDSRIIPVIKANAYGHGMEMAARAMLESHVPVAGFAVATFAEAMTLCELNLGVPVMLLAGIRDSNELRACMEHDIELVVHAPYQVDIIRQAFSNEALTRKPVLWLKHNSGMNRLGMARETCLEVFKELQGIPGVTMRLLSHLAYADDMEDGESRSFTNKQVGEFSAFCQQVRAAASDDVPASLAASAGILTLPVTHLEYVRPGVMLYGSSPLAGPTGEELGLQPVMTLQAALLAINEVKAGESVGYGATYTCERDSRIGVVGIGYADGYPRSAVNGTPVLVKTAGGNRRTRLIGRVAMDMITIDLTGMEDVTLDDTVVLWGRELCADEVARSANTIAYELFCKVTGRVEFEYDG
ncbi:MAG: alanine racemase, partial [Gammaproteobacteria bacterium]